jgi:hypothetical protein
VRWDIIIIEEARQHKKAMGCSNRQDDLQLVFIGACSIAFLNHDSGASSKVSEITYYHIGVTN